MQLSDDELHALYAWVDELPLSRPKRNIARDFSDGGNGSLQLVASCPWCQSMLSTVVRLPPPFVRRFRATVAVRLFG